MSKTFSVLTLKKVYITILDQQQLMLYQLRL